MAKKPRLNLAARTFKVELGTFLRTCESVNTARSLTCYLLASAGEWDQYLDLSRPDPESPSFADDYLVTEALRKNPQLTTSHDPRANAVASWWKAEMQCSATNVLLQSYQTGGVSPRHKETEAVIRKAQRIISDILGPLTPDKLAFMEQNFRFGPGATSCVSGNDVVLSKKYACSMHVTPRLYPYWRSLALPASQQVELRAYSRVTFVPKTSKTDRAIAIEPHLNIFVQLGIGALLRRSLRHYGIDLDRQTHVNRALASVAHVRGLATVDLSSASDTIASELVWLLLPFEWAALLDVCRTEYSLIDGQEVRLSKFSSMGNGYTFELESLIFLALARASGDHNGVAFGDDIILKSDCFPTLKNALDFLGFSVNSEKTFLAGRFFESCGYDYCNGVMVRPFYLKGAYHDFTSACIRIANKIRLYSHMRNGGYGCDIRFVRVWSYARRACPNASETCIPLGAGDDGLIKNFDEARPSRARHGHEGFLATVFRDKVRIIDSTSSPGALASVLHRGGGAQFRISDAKSIRDLIWRHESIPRFQSEGGNRYLEMTRRYSLTARGKQLVHCWPDIGPWEHGADLWSQFAKCYVRPFGLTAMIPTK